MGGGNLASKSKKKGFAISGILYPLLILTLFLVVQILFMMQTRKNVLDKSKKELSDAVNASNTIYNNEELSTLIQEQNKKIDDLESKLKETELQLKNTSTTTIESKNLLSDISRDYNARWRDYRVETYPFSCGSDNIHMRRMVQDYWPKFQNRTFSAHVMNGHGCDFFAYANKTDDSYGTVILTGYSWTTFALGVNNNGVWSWYYSNMTAY